MELVRPVWFALYIVALFPLIMAFARHERERQRQGGAALAADRRPAADLRGTESDGGDQHCEGPLGVTGVRLWLVALPFIGAAVAQFGPVHRLAQSRA